MKLASIRHVTHDVPALTAFYSSITGASAQGDDQYSEVRAPGCTLAIANDGLVEQFHPGQLATSANQSAILEFEVDDVDSPALDLVKPCLRPGAGANHDAMGKPLDAVSRP